MTAMPRATLQQIADQAGTDRGTVSRVLNGKAAQCHIGADLAKRIEAVASTLQYVPNAFARALQAGRFDSVALLMSTEKQRSYLAVRLLDGIHDELARSDLHLTVARVPDDRLNSAGYLPKILRTLMVDGLLINYTHRLPPHLVAAVEDGRLPAVWINSVRPVDAVYPDNRAAACRATAALIADGHRRIAYLDAFHARNGGDEVHYSARDRLAGYQDAMRDAGLAEVVATAEDVAPGAEWAAPLAPHLRGPRRVTAVLTYWVTEVPSIRRVAAGAGLDPERDVAVTAFAAEENEHRCFGARLMCEPQYQMGIEAARLLLAKIRGPARRQPARVLPFHWDGEG